MSQFRLYQAPDSKSSHMRTFESDPLQPGSDELKFMSATAVVEVARTPRVARSAMVTAVVTNDASVSTVLSCISEPPVGFLSPATTRFLVLLSEQVFEPIQEPVDPVLILLVTAWRIE